MKPPWKAMVVDIVVSGIIPTIVYHWLTTERQWTEAQALAGVIIFPAVMSAVDVIRDGAINIISAMSIVGIVMGLAAAYVGGDPKMLLIRESLFTVLLGVAALLSVLFEKPLMYWMSRAALARMGRDAVGGFERRYQESAALRRIIRGLTAACGALFVFEFALKVVMVYMLPVETVLVSGPIVFNVVSLGGVGIIVLYGRTAMRRAMDAPPPSPGGAGTVDAPSAQYTAEEAGRLP